MNISNIDLLGLQASFMRSDKTTKALCEVLTPEFREVYKTISTALVLPYIDLAPEWLLDELAWSWSVTWYDYAADLETKRKLIFSVGQVASALGTPAAVKRVLQAYGNEFFLEEWFDYDSNPYRFRVVVERDFGNSYTIEELAALRKAVNRVKNVRSWLEEIRIKTQVYSEKFIAGTTGLNIRLSLKSDENISPHQQTYIGGLLSMQLNIAIGGA